MTIEQHDNDYSNNGIYSSSNLNSDLLVDPNTMSCPINNITASLTCAQPMQTDHNNNYIINPTSNYNCGNNNNNNISDDNSNNVTDSSPNLNSDLLLVVDSNTMSYPINNTNQCRLITVITLIILTLIQIVITIIIILITMVTQLPHDQSSSLKSVNNCDVSIPQQFSQLKTRRNPFRRTISHSELPQNKSIPVQS